MELSKRVDAVSMTMLVAITRGVEEMVGVVTNTPLGPVRPVLKEVKGARVVKVVGTVGVIISNEIARIPLSPRAKVKVRASLGVVRVLVSLECEVCFPWL